MCCQLPSHWLVWRTVSPGSGSQLTFFSSWISEFLSFLWFVFMGTLLGNWKRLFQALLTRYQLKLEPHTCNCKRRWPTWTSRIHSSMVLWPAAQAVRQQAPPCSQPSPPWALLLLPAWLSRHIQTAHYCSPCFPHSLNFGPLNLLAPPSGMSFSTPSASLYTAPTGMSHTMYHTRYFPPVSSPCFSLVVYVWIINISWILSHEHSSWVQIMLLEPTRTHSAELSM